MARPTIRVFCGPSAFAWRLAASLWLLAIPAQAQKLFAPTRLYDNVTSDFRGIWETRSTAYINIEGHPAQKGIAASKSIIVDPAGGKIPYQPWALAKRDENFKNRLTADPGSKCSQAGVPRATYLPSPLQIVQSPGNFAFAYQDVHAYRIITWTNARFMSASTGGWATRVAVGMATPWWWMSET
jgi:hypothetical protein